MDQTEYGVLLAFCCNRIYPPLYNKNERDCLRRVLSRRKEFFFIAIKKVETFRSFKNTLEYLELTDNVIGCDREGQTKRY